jgi:hypothetical protein
MSAPLPDVYCEPQGGDTVVLVANKRVRRLLNARFEPRPRWETIDGGSNYLKSPEYRTLTLEGNCEAVVSAMLHAVHQAGMLAMFTCASCTELHIVDDERAERLWAVAIEGSDGALPPHWTLQ